MKIGVTGDTHGDQQAIRKILQTVPPVEQWLHTGDFARDADVLSNGCGVPVARVCGNCDSWENRANDMELLEFEGWHIWLTHGYKYLQDGGLDDLVWWGKNFGVQIVVFGHTHVPLFKKVQGIYLFNPGSPSRPRDGSKAGFGVLTLKKGVEPKAQFITLSDEK
jgi:putative phosphoesterase